MAETFNPYREWLQWRDDAPPNHYQLLSLAAFEADAQRIAIAGERAATKVRSFRPGGKAREWSRLLDEIQAAKECLLNPAQKARYDALLRGDTAASTAPVTPLRPQSPASSDLYPPGGQRDSKDVPRAPALATNVPNYAPSATGPWTLPAQAAPTHAPGYAAASYAHSAAQHPPGGYAAPIMPYGAPLAMPPAGVPMALPAGGYAAGPAPFAQPMAGYPPAYGPSYAGGFPAAYQPATPPAVAPPAAAPLAYSGGPYSPQAPDPMTPVTIPAGHVPAASLPVGTAVAPAVPPAGGKDAQWQPSGRSLASGSSAAAAVLEAQRSQRWQRNFLIVVVGGGLALVAAIISGAIVANNNTPQLVQIDRADGDFQEPQPIARTVESELPPARPPQKIAPPKSEPPKKVTPPAPESESPVSRPPPTPMPMPPPAAVDPPLPAPMPPPPPAPLPTRAEVMELVKLLDIAKVALSEQNFAEADESLAKAEALAKLPKHQEAVSRLKQVGGYVKQFRDAVAAAVQGFEAGATFMVGTSTQVAVVEGFPDKVILRIAGMNRTFPFREMPPGLAVAIADQKLDGADPVSRVVKGAYLLVHKRADDESRDKARTLWNEAQAGGVDMAPLMPFLTDDYAAFLKDAAEGTSP